VKERCKGIKLETDGFGFNKGFVLGLLTVLNKENEVSSMILEPIKTL